MRALLDNGAHQLERDTKHYQKMGPTERRQQKGGRSARDGAFCSVTRDLKRVKEHPPLSTPSCSWRDPDEDAR